MLLKNTKQCWLWLAFVLLSGSTIAGPIPGSMPGTVKKVLAQGTEGLGVQADQLVQQGNQLFKQRQVAAAFKLWNQALAIYRDLGDRQQESQLLWDMANAAASVGQYEAAIQLYQQRLAVTQSLKNEKDQASTLINLGTTYGTLGQYRQATRFFNVALSLFQRMGDRQGEGNALGNLGIAYRRLGEPERARESLEQARQIFQDLDFEEGVATSVINLGNVYDQLGQYQQAQASYQEALNIYRTMGNQAMESTILGNLGSLQMSLKNYATAVDLLEQARAISQQAPESASTILSNLGIAYFELGNYTKAIDASQQAIALSEKILQSLKDTERISFFEARQGTPYSNLQRALVAQGETERALEVAEASRAGALSALLRNQLQDSPQSSPLLAGSVTPTLEQMRQLARDLQATLVQYSIIFDEALYIWVVQPDGTVTFRQVLLTKAGSGKSTTANTVALLSTPLFRGQSRLAVPELIGRTRSALGVERALVEVQPRRSDESNDSLRQMYEVLIAPIQDLLPANPDDRVIFIPHRSLFMVPFAVLRDGDGKYLIEKHTISTAPSMQILALTQVQRRPLDQRRLLQPEDVLIVGNPKMPRLPLGPGIPQGELRPLPGAEREAAQIARLFKTQPVNGTAATEAAITEKMRTARLIHFATHGLLDFGVTGEVWLQSLQTGPGAIALASGSKHKNVITPRVLVISGFDGIINPDAEAVDAAPHHVDGLLTTNEILKMRLQAELVVLSACNTGRGRITGDGVVGLSRSLIATGVNSVVMSLWSVPDAPTAELMTTFYEQWLQGQDKNQALRQAMLSTMKKYPDPLQWGAFLLVGAVE